MTTLRKEPTTAEPNKTRMTGIRIAQTRGGKKFWRGWSESTKGFGAFVLAVACANRSKRGVERGRGWWGVTYHEQSPEGVVEKDKRGCHKHGDAHELVKLLYGRGRCELAKPALLKRLAWFDFEIRTIVRKSRYV